MTDPSQPATPPATPVAPVSVDLRLAAYAASQVIRPGYFAAFVGVCALIGLIFFLTTTGTTVHRLLIGVLFFVLAFFGFGLAFLSQRLLYWILSLFAGMAVDVGQAEAAAWAEKQRNDAKRDPIDSEVASFYEGGNSDRNHAQAPPVAAKGKSD